jgi:hypothetical protein
MKSRNDPESAGADCAQPVIDALASIEFRALSFAQLRLLNAALLDASERSAAETARRADDEVAGDTVRVPVPQSPDR